MSLKDLKYGDTIASLKEDIIDYNVARYILATTIYKDRKVYKNVTGGKQYIYTSSVPQISNSTELSPGESFSLDQCNCQYMFNWINDSAIIINPSYNTLVPYIIYITQLFKVKATVTVTYTPSNKAVQSITILDVTAYVYDIVINLELNGVTETIAYKATSDHIDLQSKTATALVKGLNKILNKKAKVEVEADLKKKQEKEIKELIDRYTI